MAHRVDQLYCLAVAAAAVAVAADRAVVVLGLHFLDPCDRAVAVVAVELLAALVALAALVVVALAVVPVVGDAVVRSVGCPLWLVVGLIPLLSLV